MNLELVGAIILAILAAACMVTAIIYGAWWHIGTGMGFATFAWLFGKESQEDY